MEKKRIEKNGGFVQFNRLNGRLALSRAIGDNTFKNGNQKTSVLTAIPDITRTKLTPQDSYIVIACDGLWDVMSNEDVINFINPLIDDHSVQDIVKQLGDHSIYNLGSTDNVSCILIKL